ncbi:MAG TPA: R3H domain-containing nucleic acid-binding protein [Ktedonobacterales bacterium]
MPEVIYDDLDSVLAALPPRIQEAVNRLDDRTDLLEIVLDLGRIPEGRFPQTEVNLGAEIVTKEDLAYVVGRIGQFGDDNRAGIERTLHRISAIRNRRGEVVGLTCRVGRAVRGPVALIRDVVEQGQSILILGRPGVGKTTLLREAARVLADELGKRVVVVDTSNEIAGDGDIPHPGIGRARRMQVAHPAEQHAVMIEAVENHMPEVIVIDEIGTELEAQAARTIAERGVQLVGTAHGRTLDNLLLNPTLADLVGGIQAVTLGDEEARRRGTQKTVLERKAPPTFDVLVEQQSWREVIVHRDVATAVDELLRGQSLTAELRTRDDNDDVTARRVLVKPTDAAAWNGGNGAGDIFDFSGSARGRGMRGAGRGRVLDDPRHAPIEDEVALWQEADDEADALALEPTGTSGLDVEARGVVTGRRSPVRIYPFGVSRERLEQAARQMQAPIEISRDKRSADAVITVKTFYNRQGSMLEEGERKRVYILKSNTVAQMRECLARIFELRASETPPAPRALPAERSVRMERPGRVTLLERPAPTRERAHPASQTMRDAEDAILHLLNSGQSQVELPPATTDVRRMQHKLADRYNLVSRSFGKDPYRRVRIFAR